MNTPWTQSLSGAAIDLIDPQPEQINFADMAHQLAFLFRFNGGTRRALSVARHCLNGVSALEREGHDTVTQLYMLLHDGHEYIVGDQTRPVQDMFAAIIGAEAMDKVKNHIKTRIDGAIFRAAGLPAVMPPDIAAVVKMTDNRLLASEKRDLMAEPRRPWVETPFPAYPWPVAPSANVAADRADFRATFERLSAEVLESAVARATAARLTTAA